MNELLPMWKPQPKPRLQFRRAWTVAWAAAMLSSFLPTSRADSEIYLLNMPDYRWYAGCFGTANGNFFGFWDRNGMTDFYRGPTNDGLAPMNDSGTNVGIRSMWASKAGMDGRPLDRPGHIDDYWAFYSSDGSYSYESTLQDPYVLAGRSEHTPDCIGDFIGLSQRKWTGMNGECDGNIDAYSFVYWDPTGAKRVNFTPPADAGGPPIDIQSGLKAWTEYCGYEGDVFTQLAEFNPETPPGQGFTAEDLKREIDAGYPVMVFLQRYGSYARNLSGMPEGNPDIHGVVIYGYLEDNLGMLVKLRTSWGSGEAPFHWQEWSGASWLNLPSQLSVRGVIGFRPKPKITGITRLPDRVALSWHGPSVMVHDAISSASRPAHYYVVEHSPTLHPPDFTAVTAATTNRTVEVSDCCSGAGYFRVRLQSNP